MHQPGHTLSGLSRNTHRPKGQASGSRLCRTALTLALLTSLSGCANYRGIGSDQQMLDSQQLQTGTSLAGSTAAEWPQQQWWLAFGDTQLNQLIAEALANNPSLDEAAAKIALASATLESTQSSTLPSLGLEADVTSQHYTANGLYPAPLGGSFKTSGNILLQAQYDLDFWGRNRAAVAASRSRQAEAEAEAASARLMIASAVAKTYFQLAQLENYHAIGTRALAQRQRIFDLTRQRVEAGLDTQVELKQAETQLPLTRTGLAQLDEQIATTRHALAALLGAGPDRTLNLSTANLPAAPAFSGIPADLPLALLSHRPDLVAARWQVEATLQDTHAAKAAFYPNINLTAFAGLSSIGLDKLINSDSKTYGGGPVLSLPIFDGDRLRADLKANVARYDSAVANYNQTLIAALRDVADQLTSYRALQPQTEQQQLALDAASSAFNLALQRYHAGLGNYLTVLNAESMVLQQQLFHAQLQMREQTLQVELARALGGGYPSAPATTAAIPATTTIASASNAGDQHD